MCYDLIREGTLSKTFLHVAVIQKKGASKEAIGAAKTVPRLTDGKEAKGSIFLTASQPKRLPDDSGNLKGEVEGEDAHLPFCFFGR